MDTTSDLEIGIGFTRPSEELFHGFGITNWQNILQVLVGTSLRCELIRLHKVNSSSRVYPNRILAKFFHLYSFIIANTFPQTYRSFL